MFRHWDKFICNLVCEVYIKICREKFIPYRSDITHSFHEARINISLIRKNNLDDWLGMSMHGLRTLALKLNHILVLDYKLQLLTYKTDITKFVRIEICEMGK
jgi:hypothetical protein